MKLNPRTLSLVLIIIAAIIGGGVAVYTKLAVREIPNFSFTFLRFVFASLCILPFFLKSRPKLHKDIYKVILFSLFMSVNVIVFPFGVSLTTATVSQVLYSFVPIIVAILSYYFLAEKFSAKKITGIVIGFIGALMVILLPMLTHNAPFSGNLIGNLIIMSGVVCVAMYTYLSKPFQKHYSPQQITSFFIFTTTFVLFFLALHDLQTQPGWWEDVSINALGATLYVGLMGTSVWYLLYQYVIKHGSPVLATTALFLQPATAFIWASFLLEEQLTVGVVAGVLITLSGVYLVLKSK